MILYGFAKAHRYTNSGELEIQVRVPNIHGPMDVSEYNGAPVTNYTMDVDLPWYRSILLPHMPVEGEVVMLSSTNNANTDWVVLGLTGGTYQNVV